MGKRPRRSAPVGSSRVLILFLIAFVTVGVAAPGGSVRGGDGPTAAPQAVLAHPQNGSSGGDPSSSIDSTLCPSAGPVILGIQWNCVAVLNLTEVALILASIGIIAYVFRESDRAELPGDAAEVPVTADEWETYRRARELETQREPFEESEGR